MSISTVWSTLAALYIFGAFFPSIYPYNFKLAVSEKFTNMMFPVRALLDRIVMKPLWLKYITNVRRKGCVNLAAVAWYAAGLVGLLIMLAETAFRFMSESGLEFFENAMIFIFVLLAAVVMVGILTGDRKDYKKFPVGSIDADDIHIREEAVAYRIGSEITDCQDALEPVGFHWQIDVLCTDRLDDEANKNIGGTLSALTGVPQTKPVYMSHIVVKLTDGETDVPLPCGRRIDRDIAYMINDAIRIINDDITAERCIEDVHEITRMVLYKKSIKF